MAKYILCVDDDKSILMTLRAQLKHSLGSAFRYEVAESAEEALELIEELYLDGDEVTCVISDWLMPGMKGDEFLISVHNQHPEIIKLMLTGHIDEIAKQRAEQQANLKACVTKPWDKEELLDVLAECLEFNT